VNQQWAGHPGMLVENILAPQVPYNPGGAVVPSSSAADFDSEGASISGGRSDDSTSGSALLRTGGPGQTTTIRIGSGILGEGHHLDSVSMSFRYTAGYTPSEGQTKQAPVVKVQILDLASGDVLKTVFTSQPLGDYSFDRFAGYSPRIEVNATDLDLSNDGPVILALEVTNNERNLQIPIDDIADGFGIQIRWAGEAQPGLGSIFGFAGQLWAKPQPNGAAAALLINHSPRTLNYSLSLAKLNLTRATYEVRDIWAKKPLATIKGEITLSVPAYDSAFVLLSPTSDVIV